MQAAAECAELRLRARPLAGNVSVARLPPPPPNPPADGLLGQPPAFSGAAAATTPATLPATGGVTDAPSSTPPVPRTPKNPGLLPVPVPPPSGCRAARLIGPADRLAVGMEPLRATDRATAAASAEP